MQGFLAEVYRRFNASVLIAVMATAVAFLNIVKNYELM